MIRAVAATHGPLSLVQFDAHLDTWGDYFGGKDRHGSPFRRAIEEGLIREGGYVQVGIRGPIYKEEDDFRFQIAHQVTTIDIGEVKSAGVAANDSDRVRESGQRSARRHLRHRRRPSHSPPAPAPEVGGLTSYDQRRPWGQGTRRSEPGRLRRRRGLAPQSTPWGEDHRGAGGELVVRVLVCAGAEGMMLVAGRSPLAGTRDSGFGTRDSACWPELGTRGSGLGVLAGLSCRRRDNRRRISSACGGRRLSGGGSLSIEKCFAVRGASS